ncbi:MAG: RNA polymerase sigma-70 factor [Massilibacteroides sp.]|nr:RNA polymerase sigma-70 factor [Massilibacteroides sp.]
MSKGLINRIKQGDERAFSILYHQYSHTVFNFCQLYMRSQADAEEVVQEVFVKVWESRAFIREDQSFKGFLFMVTRNLIFDKFRKRQRQETFELTVLQAMEEGYDIEDEIEASDLSQYIDTLITNLPPRCQEIFNLSRKKHLTHKEIAVQLDLSEKTIENQITKALKFLRKNLLLFMLFSVG